MATKIGINLSGFGGLELKSRSDAISTQRRSLNNSSQRRQKAVNSGLERRRERLIRDGRTSNGQLLDGRARFPRSPDQWVPRPPQNVDILHLRIGMNASSVVQREYSTKYGIVVRGSYLNPLNYPGLYRTLFGTPYSGVFVAKYTQKLRTCNSLAIEEIEHDKSPIPRLPGFKHDNNGRIINYFTAGDDRSEYIILPIGGKKCIVIFTFSSWWSVANLFATLFMDVFPGEGYSPPPKNVSFFNPYRVYSINGYESYSSTLVPRHVAFLCSEGSIRQIGIPPTLTTILNVIYPQPITYNEVINESLLDGDTAFYYTFTSKRIIGGTYINASDRQVGFYMQNAWTPSIYERLNSIYQFTNTVNIKQYPSDKGWLINDSTQGYYKSSDEKIAYYGFWNTPGTPDLSEELQPYINFTPLSGSSFPEPKNSDFLDFEESNDSLVLVWDWNAPDYCLRMCEYLGFNRQDLQI